MNIVPKSVKHSIVIGMGILIAMIGMVSIHLIVADDKTMVAMGDLYEWRLQISLVGVILVASLLYHNVPGAILLGIVILTVVFWLIEKSFPSKYVELPQWDGSQYMDFAVLVNLDRAPTIYTAVFAFVCICIFDVSGVMFGLATLGGLMREDGHIPGSIWGFIGSAIGTMVASFFGSTPIIVTVECASGVKEGGRTGLTAVVIGFYFLISLFLAPLFGAVPEGATAPVLILVGTLMMGEATKIDWESMDNAVPAFLVLTLIPLTYSITNGIVFGLVAAACFYFTTGKAFADCTSCRTGTEQAPPPPQQAVENANNIHAAEVSVYSSERKRNYGAIVNEQNNDIDAVLF